MMYPRDEEHELDTKGSLVEIVDLKTGEVRWWPDEIGFSWWWWREGNGCCDCNRAHFFHDESAAEVERPCGDGAYQVTFAWLANGDGLRIEGPVDQLASS